MVLFAALSTSVGGFGRAVPYPRYLTSSFLKYYQLKYVTVEKLWVSCSLEQEALIVSKQCNH